jgi:hypothetical protein
MSLAPGTNGVVHTAECVLFRKHKRHCYDQKSHVTAINRAASAFIPWRDLVQTIQLYLIPTNLICTCQLRRVRIKTFRNTSVICWITGIRFVNYTTPLTFVIDDGGADSISLGCYSALDKRILEFLS